MKELEHILKECSIADIYCNNVGLPIQYQIPIYQRNYAWERDEIYALIKDVHDSMATKPVYYIGTLVTFKRDENIYEVIDGQQRLTTLYIILCALKKPVTNKLTYSARKKSTKTIETMSRFTPKSEVDKEPDFGEEYDAGIKNGFQFAEAGLKEIVGEKQEDIDLFKEYFMNNVHIIHYRVPKDVDLNHYFEVMNSRGEQLEKHEIVKARLSERLNEDGDSQKKFSMIWEACSDMSFYIQQKLQSDEMKKVFGDDMSDFCIESFEDFPVVPDTKEDTSNMKSIAALLDNPVKREAVKIGYDKNDSFQPIIDFPNFLLIVLKITRMDEPDFNPTDFILDDKELINEFNKVELTPSFVKKFAYNLLLAKYYLDNYIIHHISGADRSMENPWKLQYYWKNRESAYTKDLIENDTLQSELIHLQSMFEVAFTAKQRKNYLFYCLLHLFKNWNIDDYVEFMRNLADKYFFDVYLDAEKLNENNQPKPNSFDETIIQGNKLNIKLKDIERDFNSIYHVGTSNIPLFVFNYTDYKLWKKYAIELRGREDAKAREAFFKDLGCNDFGRDIFNRFYFSRTRKSLEHYYPQAKAGEDKQISTKDINCFGNFAMIGSDANSSGSNWNPIDKKNRYLDIKSNQVSVASLKFRIMLQICQDNYDEGVKTDNRRAFGFEWNVDDIQKHQTKMLNIIMQPTS